ncbi:mycothiol system anti-sigma-R factor [Cellulomonas sp. P24]|uniref:mycothiol system anti-sigma-R factor n=1 Tax=Cellulomonas sp. P24 TaxID=2885206 RepID=UPI00216AE8A2|nr:mycothiol system anti-sigma-R factor [Cellulomonas sp. P24]MCR6491678.1 mycothiol system anti-sigma-R factor [Cellulomonas sp. P24]
MTDTRGGGEAAPHLDHDEVDCGQALGQLFEYLDAELGTPDSERIRAHLAECAPCLGEYDVEVVVKNLVKRCCQESAPADLRLRIHERLTVEHHLSATDARFED